MQLYTIVLNFDFEHCVANSLEFQSTGLEKKKEGNPRRTLLSEIDDQTCWRRQDRRDELSGKLHEKKGRGYETNLSARRER